MTNAERLFATVVPEPNSGCWLWDGYVHPSGYGRVGINGAYSMAHRAAYEAFVGPIGGGWKTHSVDHLCRVRICINPDHLEVVPIRENILRGDTIAAMHAAQELCIAGHAFTKRADGKRVCPTCANRRRREWHQRHLDHSRAMSRAAYHARKDLATP